jgi:hypothetical protein
MQMGDKKMKQRTKRLCFCWPSPHKKYIKNTVLTVIISCAIIIILIIICNKIFNDRHDESLTLAIARTIIALFSFIGMLYIYYKSAVERQHLAYIQGLEKLIHSFVTRYFTHVNNRIKAVYDRKSMYQLNKESIWLALDDIYGNNDETCADEYIRARRLFERFIGEWLKENPKHEINTIEDFRDKDILVRKEYGIWMPPQILKNYDINDREGVVCGWCGIVNKQGDVVCSNCRNNI